MKTIPRTGQFLNIGAISPGVRLIALLAVVLFVSCRDVRPVKVGFIGGLSGRDADLGIAGRDGALLAVEEANRTGGIRGRRIELVSWDDRQDAETARRALAELAREGVRVVVGPMTSSMAVAVVPIANERKILLVSPTTSTDELEGLDDFFLRVYPSADRGAPILARHLYRDAGKDRVSIVYDLGNRAYTESFAGAFEKEFVSIGGTVTGTSTFTSGPDVDFLGLAREIADRGAPAVHIVANALDTAMLCQQFSKIGYYPLVVTGEWSVTPDILSFGGHTVEGLRFFHTFDRGSTQEAYISFRDRFEDRFHYEPGFAAVHGYDAMRVVLWALEQGPDGDASALKRAILKRASFQGLQTDFRFDETGDVSREHFLLTIQDGAFVRLR